MYLRADLAGTLDGVLLRWAMVDERNVVGFNIWLSNGVDSEMRSNALIVAKQAGLANWV